MISAHFAAVLRGWWPHWRAELRTVPAHDWYLLGALAAVLLLSAANVWKGARR